VRIFFPFWQVIFPFFPSQMTRNFGLSAENKTRKLKDVRGRGRDSNKRGNFPLSNFALLKDPTVNFDLILA